MIRFYFIIIILLLSLSMHSQQKRGANRLLAQSNTICSVDSSKCRSVLNIRQGKKRITVVYDTLNRVYFVNGGFKREKYKVTYIREENDTYEYHVKESRNGKIKKHFLYKNNSLWVKGKSTQNHRIRVWKQYSLDKELAVVGKIKFTISNKDKKYKEDCPNSFSCSEIIFSTGNTDGILSEYW